jgi:hypothetical protein
VLLAAVAVQDSVAVGDLTRDATATTGTAWYIGSVSALGSLGWAAAAAISGFAALVVRHRDPSDQRFLRFGLLCAFTAFLALDDTLLLHEDVLLRLLGSELPIYAVYGLVGVTWLAWSRSEIAAENRPALVVALGGFALSVGVDLMWDSSSGARILVEDGAKFVGIWSWAAFVGFHSFSALVEGSHDVAGKGGVDRPALGAASLAGASAAPGARDV